MSTLEERAIKRALTPPESQMSLSQIWYRATTPDRSGQWNINIKIPLTSGGQEFNPFAGRKEQRCRTCRINLLEVLHHQPTIQYFENNGYDPSEGIEYVKVEKLFEYSAAIGDVMFARLLNRVAGGNLSEYRPGDEFDITEFEFYADWIEAERLAPIADILMHVPYCGNRHFVNDENLKVAICTAFPEMKKYGCIYF